MASAIAALFNKIAPSYDRLNHLLSLGIDKLWRKKALKGCKALPCGEALDVACGTADLSIALVKAGASRVEGVDISQEMLSLGRRKVERSGLAGRINLRLGDVAALDYADNRFDMVTVSFGVRNFRERGAGLAEMCRVLRPGGRLVILEFSIPRREPVKTLYGFYFKRVLPWVGGLLSGDRAAYDYLPASVYAFPEPKAFCRELQQAGFVQMEHQAYTCGIATVYYATKQ